LFWNACTNEREALTRIHFSFFFFFWRLKITGSAAIGGGAQNAHKVGKMLAEGRGALGVLRALPRLFFGTAAPFPPRPIQSKPTIRKRRVDEKFELALIMLFFLF
jgi:hypothetical protein